MLAHSPPLPLVLDYFEEGRDFTAEDEKRAILALKQRNRIRRVRICIPFTTLQKLILAMDEEYPILQYLVITLPIEDKSSILIIPETLQAPNLRHLRLNSFALPIGSRILTTAVGLVTLSLVMVHPSTYFHPNTLLQWISLMPQLETLTIYFESPILNRDVETQLTHTPIVAPVTLPSLHYFQFHGVSTYSEALVRRITAPRLEKIDIDFFNRFTFFVPRLLQLMNTAANLRFDSTRFKFSDEKVYVTIYPYGEFELYPLGIVVLCSHLDWQVSFVTQISNSLSQILSAVERLTLEHEEHSQSSEEHNQVDRTNWRELLRPFSNVKTLLIDSGLVEELSRCLQSEDGEPPLELLPELQELTHFGSGDTGGGFTSFINARQNAGRPVTLVRG
jgi:hypothetical protein